jgi:pimeloyl-ACP methyl ester carboxylesterase
MIQGRSARIGLLSALAAAAFVQLRTAAAERGHRRDGRFVHVDRTAVHYLERGEGRPLVMLHGLGAMIDDLVLSGLVSRAAAQHRVLAIDRPGYGRSSRPRDRLWTPMAQAELLHEVLRRLGIHEPLLLGHSFGATVALAYALRYPVERLVLVSGYYYPSARLDAPLLIPPAIPVVGDLLRYTISPLAGRALWPAWARLLFAPRPVARRFRSFPTWLALRPSQLRAVGEDAALLLPSVKAMANDYRKLAVPTTVIAGAQDRYVSPKQAERLHAEVAASELVLGPGAGHMAHYAAAERLVQALGTAPSTSSLRARA